eukprot:6185155-Amphidinium_carterae.1
MAKKSGVAATRARLLTSVPSCSVCRWRHRNMYCMPSRFHCCVKIATQFSISCTPCGHETHGRPIRDTIMRRLSETSVGIAGQIYGYLRQTKFMMWHCARMKLGGPDLVVCAELSYFSFAQLHGSQLSGTQARDHKNARPHSFPLRLHRLHNASKHQNFLVRPTAMRVPDTH